MQALLVELLTNKSSRKKANLKKAALSSTANTLLWSTVE